jgi:hypothetical protein
VLGELTHERLAGPREIAQFGDGSGRGNAAADQARRQHIGDAGGVVHVTLTPRDLAPVSRVGEHELEVDFRGHARRVSRRPQRSDPADRDPGARLLDIDDAGSTPAPSPHGGAHGADSPARCRSRRAPADGVVGARLAAAGAITQAAVHSLDSTTRELLALADHLTPLAVRRRVGDLADTGSQTPTQFPQ